MAATLVQTKTSLTTAITTLAFDSDVTAGNLIIFTREQNPGGLFSPSDSQGNTYYLAARSDNYLANLNVAIYYAIASASGPLTITSTFGNNMIIAEYHAPGYVYTQGSCALGGSGAETRIGITVPLETADTLLLTSYMRDNYTSGITSNSGDTLVAASQGGPFAHGVWLFSKDIAVAGTTYSEIQSFSGGDGGQSICAATFSKALARPDGLIAQHGVQPGVSYWDNTTEQSPADGSVMSGTTGAACQRNVRGTLPYQTQLGNLVVIGVTCPDYQTSYTVSDTYGNTYHKIVEMTAAGDTNNKVALYYTVLTHLPSEGVFSAQATVDNTSWGGGAVYRCPAMAIAEYQVVLDGTPSGSVIATANASGGNFKLKCAAVSALANSLIVGVAGMTNATSGYTDSFVWTESGSYTLEDNWEFVQFTGAAVNTLRASALSIVARTISASESVTAEVLVDNLGSGYGMAMAVFPLLALSLACPVDGTGDLGEPFSAALVVAGGSPPYTFALTSGSFPLGLTLDTSTGVISGTPSQAGTFPYEVTVTDFAGDSVPVDCSIVIAFGPPPDLTAACPVVNTVVVNTSYSESIVASGGTPPYTYTLLAGSFPPGVTLNASTGLISGTPTETGIFSYTVQVEDTVADTVQIDCQINVTLCGDPPASFDLLDPADGETGVSVMPTLEWEASAGATLYSVYLAVSPGTPVLVGTTTDTTYQPGILTLGKCYRWYVIASNDCGDVGTTIRSFRMACPNPQAGALPQVGGFATSPSTVRWSDNETFDGFVWLGLTLPDDSDFVPSLKAAQRFQPLPRYTKVPIISGTIDTTTQVFYSCDINPPGTMYKAYWYSIDGNLINPPVGTAVAFTVSSATTTLTAPSLPVPTYTPNTLPVPEP